MQNTKTLGTLSVLPQELRDGICRSVLDDAYVIFDSEYPLEYLLMASRPFIWEIFSFYRNQCHYVKRLPLSCK